jgi:hypothetical protein
MINKDLKYYERLIEKELASLASGKQAESEDEADLEQTSDLLPKKKKLKKELDKKRKHKIDHLELVVGIYKLLIFNFVKYSTKYNYSKLINLFHLDSSGDQSTNVDADQNDLVKYFCLKISSLLLNLSPIQEDNLFSKQFTNEKLESIYLK